MANKAKQGEQAQAKRAFIAETTKQYRAQANKEGLKEITGDAWAVMMQARMQKIYGSKE